MSHIFFNGIHKIGCFKAHKNYFPVPSYMVFKAVFFLYSYHLIGKLFLNITQPYFLKLSFTIIFLNFPPIAFTEFVFTYEETEFSWYLYLYINEHFNIFTSFFTLNPILNIFYPPFKYQWFLCLFIINSIFLLTLHITSLEALFPLFHVKIKSASDLLELTFIQLLFYFK